MLIHLFLLKPDLTSDRIGREHPEPRDARVEWYDHAATLEVEPWDDVEDTLQAVWARTQHGASDWTRNGDVRWVSGPNLRSSSVGDVVVLEGSGERAAYEVAVAGFRRIDVPAAEVPPVRTTPPLPSELE